MSDTTPAKQNDVLRSNTFVEKLSTRLEDRANDLETVHMEAAIDYKLVESERLSRESSQRSTGGGAPAGDSKEDEDYLSKEKANPNAVENILSPFVPSSAEAIGAFVMLVDLQPYDVLLDIGCGDGRVCMSSSALTGCASTGVDVSPACIDLANSVAREEGLDECCKFEVVDVVVDCNDLLTSKDIKGVNTQRLFRNASVIFLFVYPTLLVEILPLLARLTDTSRGGNGVRAIVTQTYHIEESEDVEVEEIGRDEENGLRMIGKVTWKGGDKKAERDRKEEGKEERK
jgi:SAM-dependent methyltransferase